MLRLFHQGFYESVEADLFAGEIGVFHKVGKQKEGEGSAHGRGGKHVWKVNFVKVITSFVFFQHVKKAGYVVQLKVCQQKAFVGNGGKIRNDHVKNITSWVPVNPVIAGSEIYQKTSLAVPQTEAVAAAYIIHTYFHFAFLPCVYAHKLQRLLRSEAVRGCFP